MNKEVFEDLQQRLHGHHFQGVDNGYTASPFYLIQVKKVD